MRGQCLVPRAHHCYCYTSRVAHCYGLRVPSTATASTGDGGRIGELPQTPDVAE